MLRAGSSRSENGGSDPGFWRGICPFGYLERILDLNLGVSNGALQLDVLQNSLHGSQILCPSVDQRGLVLLMEWVPYIAGSRPIRTARDFTSCACWRVEM